MAGGIGGSTLLAFLAWLCGAEENDPPRPDDDDPHPPNI
jgi:hypothetical protein